jgi:ABC-type antimicrobial peptide transport system permease subunit
VIKQGCKNFLDDMNNVCDLSYVYAAINALQRTPWMVHEGVYSVMAHLVTFRTSEIGIRMALGATPGTVMRMVLGHSSRLTLMGIVLGVAGGYAASRLMQQALFEVNPANPLFYLAVSGTLLLVAICASWFPARRAMRIDPVRALRME